MDENQNKNIRYLLADNLIKYKKKTYSEEQDLVDSRYELLTTAKLLSCC